MTAGVQQRRAGSPRQTEPRTEVAAAGARHHGRPRSAAQLSAALGVVAAACRRRSVATGEHGDESLRAGTWSTATNFLWYRISSN